MEKLYLILRFVNAIGIIVVLSTITAAVEEKLTEDEENLFNTVRFTVASTLILINLLLCFLAKNVNQPLFRFIVLALICFFISAYNENEYAKNKKGIREERAKIKN